MDFQGTDIHSTTVAAWTTARTSRREGRRFHLLRIGSTTKEKEKGAGQQFRRACNEPARKEEVKRAKAPRL